MITYREFEGRKRRKFERVEKVLGQAEFKLEPGWEFAPVGSGRKPLILGLKGGGTSFLGGRRGARFLFEDC